MSADGRGGHPFGNQARRDAGSLEQRLENLALWGKVEKVDEEAGKVRVRFGQQEGEQGAETNLSVLSPWIPVAEKRWYDNREWRLPEIDEWVLVISTGGLIENGVVVASIPYRDDENDKGFVHAAKSKEDERTIYGPVKVLADLVLNSFRTFNRALAVFWHYLKDGGKFRFEIGKNATTNTYFEVRDGLIEMRVGASKLRLTKEGIRAFYSGNAAVMELDKEGFKVTLDKEQEYAEVPTDNYEGGTGEPQGAGVESVQGITRTTFRVRNGQVETTIDEKAQILVTPTAVLTTLKDNDGNLRAQHIIAQDVAETTVFEPGNPEKFGTVVVTKDSADVEVHAEHNLRATLIGTLGEYQLKVDDTRFVLKSGLMDLRIGGVSLTFTPEQWAAVAPFFLFQRGSAPPSEWNPATQPSEETPMMPHPEIKPPDDLARPVIELGVKPFTPSN